MKIVVCVKLAVAVPKFVEFTSDGAEVDPAFASRELNDADAHALEEALRLRDLGTATEVVAVTVGEDVADEALRQSLARGADRALRVAASASELHDPIGVARRLASAIRAEAPDLVLCGVQSRDLAQQSTGPALASALGFPSVSAATKIEVNEDKKTLSIQREFEGGLRELVEVDLPAVVTAQVGMNAPRYGSFKGMMRAKKMPIPVVMAAASEPTRLRVRRMFIAESGGKRKVEMVEGGAPAVAARILDLVREALA